MKKTIFLALAMVIFSGCGKADSAECPDLRTQEQQFDVGSGARLYIRARDDISIHNIIINRGNCLYVYKSGFYRNGVDRIQYEYGGKSLTSDYIEQSIKEKYREKYYKELNAGPKKLAENIDLKFGEERSIWLSCKALEVVFETNLGQCEYKFD